MARAYVYETGDPKTPYGVYLQLKRLGWNENLCVYKTKAQARVHAKVINDSLKKRKYANA